MFLLEAKLNLRVILNSKKNKIIKIILNIVISVPENKHNKVLLQKIKHNNIQKNRIKMINKEKLICFLKTFTKTKLKEIIKAQ